jgi:hypothetical protein
VRSDESIPGLRALLGAGVYTSVPAILPASLREGMASVRGTTAASADAVLRLADWCRTVTFIKPTRSPVAALRGRANVTILHAAEIVCVDGIGRLECIVVRQIHTGTVSAHIAAALFLLP